MLFGNGADVPENRAFPGTGAWVNWGTVPGKAGANTVSLIFNPGKGSKNFINLDSLEVKSGTMAG